jgi:magnesium chelatase family protein
MVAHIQTIAFSGVDALPVDVQVHLAPGQNAFNVVGLPDKSVAESRERVLAALADAMNGAVWPAFRPLRD